MPPKPKAVVAPAKPVEAPAPEVSKPAEPEAPVAPVEAKVEAPKPEEQSGKHTLGPAKIKIMHAKKVSINGREYNELALENNTTVVLNDEDLQKQIDV